MENTRRDSRCKGMRQFNYDVFLESMTAMLEKEVISSEYIYIYRREKKYVDFVKQWKMKSVKALVIQLVAMKF